MPLETTSAALLAPPEEGESLPAPVQSFFVHTAVLEFQAALQLLVERACFLTAANGAAVALKEQGQFIYSAAAGEFAAETGTLVNLNKKYLGECVRLGQTVRTRTDSLFALAVPVMRGADVVGIFELLGKSAFEDCDAISAARLGEMIGTAIDHRDAAVRAEKVEFEEVVDAPSAPTPSRWHAPDIKEPKAEKESAAATSPIEVQKCSSCGFPVSNGRKFCPDCERNMDEAPDPAELFSMPPQESWLNTHGYTIASVLVSAIAIAIIVWLRTR